MNIPGQLRLNDTKSLINEINELIYKNLDKQWMTVEWEKKENGESADKIHPLVNAAFDAYQHIDNFIRTNTAGITPAIWEISELAIKINNLKRNNVKSLQNRIDNLISFDHSLYLTARYEIQVAGMLLSRGHGVEFIEECGSKTPDILAVNGLGKCEIECKHKDPSEDQLDYIKSIYNNTQGARKQFSKNYPGLIFIDIAKNKYGEYQIECKRLLEEIERALRNSFSISAIIITSKVSIEECDDFVYRHRAFVIVNKNPRYIVSDWLKNNLISK